MLSKAVWWVQSIQSHSQGQTAGAQMPTERKAEILWVQNEDKNTDTGSILPVV